MHPIIESPQGSRTPSLPLSLFLTDKTNNPNPSPRIEERGPILGANTCRDGVASRALAPPWWFDRESWRGPAFVSVAGSEKEAERGEGEQRKTLMRLGKPQTTRSVSISSLIVVNNRPLSHRRVPRVGGGWEGVRGEFNSRVIFWNSCILIGRTGAIWAFEPQKRPSGSYDPINAWKERGQIGTEIDWLIDL